MMYRKYYTEQEWDDIVNKDHDEWDHDVRPHCDPETFHPPGDCPFCDGYYLRHLTFEPAQFAPLEGNGWAGNAAPQLNRVKAEQERSAWSQMLVDVLVGVSEEERVSIRQRTRQILDRFIR